MVPYAPIPALSHGQVFSLLALIRCHDDDSLPEPLVQLKESLSSWTQGLDDLAAFAPEDLLPPLELRSFRRTPAPAGVHMSVSPRSFGWSSPTLGPSEADPAVMSPGFYELNKAPGPALSPLPSSPLAETRSSSPLPSSSPPASPSFGHAHLRSPSPLSNLSSPQWPPMRSPTANFDNDSDANVEIVSDEEGEHTRSAAEPVAARNTSNADDDRNLDDDDRNLYAWFNERATNAVEAWVRDLERRSMHLRREEVEVEVEVVGLSKLPVEVRVEVTEGQAVMEAVGQEAVVVVGARAVEEVQEEEAEEEVQEEEAVVGAQEEEAVVGAQEEEAVVGAQEAAVVVVEEVVVGVQEEVVVGAQEEEEEAVVGREGMTTALGVATSVWA
ncbi:hypothetical protein DFP72DRAFT_1067965 [Ephemerocybe angulata]|uniref:Uncharacterized protein n=1 Tax=Ephemerocybe angulata TaxID=980116 RepID=A0A8H6HYH9_9AGAR|nr:hypothetical protein DFP72DRAFT_1067965 [Tulosesus angulatus]